MRYDAYSYLWPPRPSNAIPFDTIGFYEQRGWWAQVKKNGTCTVIFAQGDEVIFKTRHDDDHKAWAPLPEHAAFFAGRPGWNVYVAELLHSKTANVKNHLYLFDVLVSDGEQLTGETFASRQRLLRDRFPAIPGIGGVGATLVSPFASLAVNYSAGFADVWKSLRSEDEGLVFKDSTARLKPCVTQTSNDRWQVKCRRASNKYSF